MADKKASITNIPLNGSLNLNRFEGDIQNYSGFHQDNSIYLGGIKQGLYKSSISIPEDQTLITSYKGNIYTYKKDESKYYILKNGKVVHTISRNQYIEGEGSYKGNIYLLSPNTVSIDGKSVSLGENDNYTSLSYIKVNISEKDFYLITLFTDTDDFGNLIYNVSDDKVVPRMAISTPDDDKIVEFITLSNESIVLFFKDSSGKRLKWGQVTHLRGWMYYNGILFSPSGWADVDNDFSENDDVKMVLDNHHFEMYEYKKSLDKVIDRYAVFIDSAKTFPGDNCTVPIATNTDGTWTNGLLISTCSASDNPKDYFSIIYYGGNVDGISHGGKLITFADSVEHAERNKIYFTRNNRQKFLEIKMTDKLDFSILDNVLIFNTETTLNALDMDTDTTFCSCPDYNHRAIPWIQRTSETENIEPGSEVRLIYGSGYNEQAQRDKQQFMATVYPSTELSLFYPKSYYSYDFQTDYKYSNDDNSINIYWAEKTDTPAIYYGTRLGNTNKTERRAAFLDFYFPDSDNILRTVPLLNKIKPTNLGKYVIADGENSYISTTNSASMPMLAYYMLTETEFESLFCIHGSYYANNKQYLEAISIENGAVSNINTVANKNDLQFIGNTMQMAFYYSIVDRSIYSFTGDVTFNKYIESTRITDISAMFCEPSKNIIFLGTNDGTIIYYDSQLIRLTDEINPERIYYDNGVFIIGNNMYSFNEREGFERMPVEFESEYYSSDITLEEVNDCVYIRLFDENPKEGTFEISCGTMTETSVDSISKTFHIKPSMFDSNHVLKLRYQPRLQRGAFKFKVKSDYPIASIAISHKPNNVSNATYNL